MCRSSRFFPRRVHQLREDPLLAVLGGKQQVAKEPLAGKSTLNRLELGGKEPSR